MCLYLFTFVLFLAFNTSISDGTRNRKIFGGKNISIEEFPFLVRIHVTFSSIMADCTGVYIHRIWVLTAAHCVEDGTIEIGSAQCCMGSSNTALRNCDQIRKVVKIVLTKGPAPHFPDDDIVMLKLERPFSLSKNVRIAVLQKTAVKHATLAGRLCNATGWGIIEGDLYNDDLYATVVKLLSTCTEKRLCTGEIPTGVCSGDSGGPLVSNGVVIGILSGSDESPCKVPAKSETVPTAYYVKVDYYYSSFIKPVIDGTYSACVNYNVSATRTFDRRIYIQKHAPNQIHHVIYQVTL